MIECLVARQEPLRVAAFIGHRLSMIIKVRPCKKFKGAWVAFEAPGVEPAFPDPNGKQDAIDYARGRFGGSRGKIHVYCDDASIIERRILIDGRGQYPQSGCD